MPAYDIRTEFDTTTLNRHNQAPFGTRDIALTTGASDLVAPTVVFVSPTPGGNLPETGAVVVNVTDVGGLAGTFVTVSFMDGTTRVVREVVYDVDGFDSSYASSTRLAIANGFQFTIRRAAGWPLGLTIDLKFTPFDTAGN